MLHGSRLPDTRARHTSTPIIQEANLTPESALHPGLMYLSVSIKVVVEILSVIALMDGFRRVVLLINGYVRGGGIGLVLKAEIT